jgi:hypothetical protein
MALLRKFHNLDKPDCEIFGELPLNMKFHVLAETSTSGLISCKAKQEARAFDQDSARQIIV